MILRIWRGWTTPEDAAAFESLLVEDQYPEIADDLGEGYRGYELARREDGDRVEFVTITRFADWETVEAFAGEDYRRAYLPPAEEALLLEYEEYATHYEVQATG
ncbi:MAG: antibiotic biosynthesis monooxygenase [Halobacteriaceae archaeon]